MQKHSYTITETSEHSSLEKYTSHFIWKGSKGLLKVLLCERWVGGRTELQHIDSHSYSHNSVSFPFSWAAQPGAQPLRDMFLIPVSSLQLTRSSCRRGYIIIWPPLLFLRASQFRTQFNPSIVKVISWYSSTGCTCYLHWCISYLDSLAWSEVNIQQLVGFFI